MKLTLSFMAGAGTVLIGFFLLFFLSQPFSQTLESSRHDLSEPVASAAVATTPLSAQEKTGSASVPAQEVDADAAVAPQSPTAAARRAADLSARLNQQEQQTQRLRDSLNAALDELDGLRTRVDRLAAASAAQGASARSKTVDGATFTEAGFDTADADYLAGRWNDRNMELLYLRNQAIREGWRDSERYRDMRRELLDGYAFDQELSQPDYDRFLYATGQNNRVAVAGVIGGSPASSAGIETGDLIISYDGEAVYNGADLRRATTSGEPDQPVNVLVDRGGSLVTVELPRGVIGVRTENRSVAPAR